MAPNTGIVNLPRLTSLRFFAASGVFMYHLCRIYPGMPLKATSTVGYVGVAFFFVLSGFVLTWSTPIYNGVEAKSCEAFFYLCAPLLISVLNALKPLQRYLAAAAGAGVAWSIGLAMVCLRTGQVTTVSGILMVPAFAWLIYACAQADLDGVRGVLRLKLLEHLGITSFAFYLVHELVLLNLKPLPWPHGSKLVNLATVIVLWVICQAAAELLYRGVERPAQRRIRAWAAAHKGKNETKAGHYSLQPGRASGQAGTPGTGVDDAGNGTSVTGGHRLDSAGSAAGAGHDGAVAQRSRRVRR